jgi:hypothetical protein
MAETLTEVLTQVHLNHAEGYGWQTCNDGSEWMFYDCECGAESGPLVLIDEGADALLASQWHSAHVATHLADAVRAWLLGRRLEVEVAIGSVNKKTGHLYLNGNDACPAAADAVLGALTKADQ